MFKKKRVVARLFGGLGNQIFIYAYARALSLRNNCELYLDTRSGFINDPYKRKFSLKPFILSDYKESSLLNFDFIGGKYLKKIIKKYNDLFISDVKRKFFVSEPSSSYFNEDYKSIFIRKTIWIEGYWQSPLYFEDIKKIIHNDFMINTPLSFKTKEIAEKIKNTNSICIHIRRLRNEIVGEDKAIIKTLPLSYYYQAISLLIKDVKKPAFFCFSDNPTWAKENIEMNFPVIFIDHNFSDNLIHEDLYLMSLCKHFIISNSTFSWWGAWLSVENNKSVICPNENYWDNKSILPEDWICL